MVKRKKTEKKDNQTKGYFNLITGQDKKKKPKKATALRPPITLPDPDPPAKKPRTATVVRPPPAPSNTPRRTKSLDIEIG